MIKRFIAASAAAVLFAGAASAEDMTSVQNYACNDGSELGVAYINTEAGEAFAVLLIDGEMHVAPVAVSASGARYVSGAGEGYSWHVKNAEGLLARVKGGMDQSEGARTCSEVGAERSDADWGDVTYFIGGDAECDVDVSVYADHVEYKLTGQTENNDICDFRVQSKAGQQFSLQWLTSSNHEAWIVGAEKSIPFADFEPYGVTEEEEVRLHIGLPRAYARRATAPAPFALSVTVK